MATAVRTLQNFIGGDWAEATGDDAREIVSPVTGETTVRALSPVEATHSPPMKLSRVRTVTAIAAPFSGMRLLREFLSWPASPQPKR